MTWRLLSTPPLAGAANMAIDVWLMERARRTGESVLRTYQWSRPTISLGRNQKARDGYDLVRLDERGIDVVRRPTGGRAILHWRELTYSVTAPADGRASVSEEYGRINTLLVHSLSLLGAVTEIMAGGGRGQTPGTHPCFAEPSHGEIVVRNGAALAKLVGSAQCRQDGALLQHGSILLHDDQPLLLELTGEAIGDTRAVALSAVLGRDVGAAEVGDALFSSIRELLDDSASSMEPADVVEAARNMEAVFLDPLWTWRR